MEQSAVPKGKVITDEVAGHISRVEELSYELRVEDVMARPVKVVAPQTPIIQVLDLFQQARISGAPVVSEDRLVGIISLEDLIRSLRQGSSGAPVSSYMTSEVTTVKPFAPVLEALEVFSETGFGRLPVVDEAGKLVGIITKGDITLGVLHALQRDYQTEEVRRYRVGHLFEDIVSDRTSLILRYAIKPRDFALGGAAASAIKQALLRLGVDPQFARRCGIAAYEAEMNLVIHATNGGVIRIAVEPDRILVKAIDDGPGIEDIELAMKPGYSTASQEVRDLGFGAGMGLKNIKRCVDEMVLESTPGKGTRLEMKIFLYSEDTVMMDFREFSAHP